MLAEECPGLKTGVWPAPVVNPPRLVVSPPGRPSNAAGGFLVANKNPTALTETRRVAAGGLQDRERSRPADRRRGFAQVDNQPGAARLWITPADNTPIRGLKANSVPARCKPGAAGSASDQVSASHDLTSRVQKKQRQSPCCARCLARAPLNAAGGFLYSQNGNRVTEKRE